MDLRLARAALLAIPCLVAFFALLAQTPLRPLTAALIGMSAYWTLLALALWRHRNWSLRPGWPGMRLAVVFGGIALTMCLAALPALGRLSPHVLAAVALAALLNGFLEEAFWRGALIPRLALSDWRAAIPPMLLFTLWHAAPAVMLTHLAVPGGAVAMFVFALGFGGLATAARLVTGTAGLSAILHVSGNLAVFAHTAVTNGSSPFP